MTSKLLTAGLILSAIFALSACSDSNDPLAPAAAPTTPEKARDGVYGRPATMGPGVANRTTIVDVALAVNAESGEFSTLIAALQAAGLVGALDGFGQFTVFAPVDAAFAALGLNAGNIGTVPVDQLKGILLYHVARGERLAADVVSSERIRTLSGGFLIPSVQMDLAYVNDAQILATDIQADNGVIHVIGSVLQR